MSFIYIWQFSVMPGKEKEFESVYGGTGPWVKMFRTDSHYIGTLLIRDMEVQGRYITIDTWKDRSSCLAFRDKHKNEFALLDAQCESLTTSETKLGEYESVE